MFRTMYIRLFENSKVSVYPIFLKIWYYYTTNSNLTDTFDYSVNIEEFWCKKTMGYSNVRRTALRFPAVFSTPHSCERRFFAVNHEKQTEKSSEPE